jgi:hypothetical protein
MVSRTRQRDSALLKIWWCVSLFHVIHRQNLMLYHQQEASRHVVIYENVLLLSLQRRISAAAIER